MPSNLPFYPYSIHTMMTLDFRRSHTLYTLRPHKTPVDPVKTLTRLELIKSLIALEEIDDIEPHLIKLNQQLLTGELIQIVNLLHSGQYAKAILLIDAFSHTYRTATVWADAELNALKFEIRTLEQQVLTLETEKASIEKMLHAFSTQHTLRLGDLIVRLLERYRQQATTDDEYTQAEAEYQQYDLEFDDLRGQTRFHLTPEAQRELKRKFRKAAQLCHPDVVAEELKNRAEAIFGELKAAHDCNDLGRVSELLHLLEGDVFFVSRSQTVTSKDLLKSEQIRLQATIRQLQNTIQTLRQSESYQAISQIADWEVYFTAIRQQLEAQLNQAVATN